jgi:predicted sulfurtransferase
MLARTQDSTKPRPVMLDVRNQYEYDVGHFDGAVRPQGVVCRTRLEP